MPLPRGMMQTGMVVMRAAGGETCAGIGVMHAARGAAPSETAVSPLPGAATELPGWLSHPAKRAVRRPAGGSPGPGRLMPNPARVERLTSPAWHNPTAIL